MEAPLDIWLQANKIIIKKVFGVYIPQFVLHELLLIEFAFTSMCVTLYVCVCVCVWLCVCVCVCGVCVNESCNTILELLVQRYGAIRFNNVKEYFLAKFHPDQKKIDDAS